MIHCIRSLTWLRSHICRPAGFSIRAFDFSSALPLLLPRFSPPTMPKAASYYAVAKGRQLGVFNTWGECEAQITGVSGSKYKKFRSKEEAENFIKENDQSGRWAQEHNQQPEQAISQPPARSGPVKNLDVTTSSSSRSASSSTSKKRERDDDHDTDPAATSSSQTRRKLSPVTIDLTESPAEEFKHDNSKGSKKVISVYCDGAASKNGKYGARAGYGVWFADDGDLSKLNESKRLPGALQTNNRAELMVRSNKHVLLGLRANDENTLLCDAGCHSCSPNSPSKSPTNHSHRLKIHNRYSNNVDRHLAQESLDHLDGKRSAEPRSDQTP